MIHDLHVQNYRALTDLAIDPLKRVNLIVGANNSSKTSLLEAIYLLTSQDKPGTLAAILQERGEFLAADWRGIRSDPNHVAWNQLEGFLVNQLFQGRASGVHYPISIQSSLPPNVLTLTLGNGEGNKVPAHHLAIKCHLEGDEPTVEKLEIENTLLRRLTKVNRNRLQPSEPYFITTNHLDFVRTAQAWDNIVLTPAEDRVITALRLVEPDIERVSFTGGRTSHSGVLVRVQGEATPVPLDSMGDGVRRILTIIIPLVSIGAGTLLIDEIDTGLYYATLKDMWRVVIETAVQQGAQVFATTHSWDCVKAFQQALSASTHHDEGALIRLDRENQQVKATIYTADELDIAVPQGIEVR